jgi:hypothetical protein
VPFIIKAQALLIKFYTKKKKSFFDMSYITQKEILDKFNEPQSLIERSFFQYSCQMLSLPLWLRIFQNLSAIFLLPYFFIKPYKRPQKPSKTYVRNNAVFLREGVNIGIIPESLRNEYEMIYESPIKDKIVLGFNDKKFFLKNVVRYWFAPFFCLKILLKIGIYSKNIYIYKPVAIITHNEVSFSSSFLTLYCKNIGVKHINVMHGEKLFNIHDSFVQFDRFYVWDKHYVDLFIQLRANKDQFKIELPNSVKINIYQDNECKYDYTYYLARKSIKSFLEIKRSLLLLGIPSSRICIRYHPRSCYKEQIFKTFNEFHIEDPIQVSLEKSIAQTRNIVSLFSTVLFQAYQSGKNIIIDDLSEPEKYQQLRDLKYIMINKPHHRLSKLVYKLNKTEVSI